MIDTFLNYSSMAKESPTVVLRDCLRTAFIHIHYLVWQDTCKVGRSKNWLVLHNHKNLLLFGKRKVPPANNLTCLFLGWCELASCTAV